ncbi:MAG: hypothetical protein IPN22_14845 [Bacteroidetes bacterium]|nr:hypothetical protein [Bacteroidota bacterium]
MELPFTPGYLSAGIVAGPLARPVAGANPVLNGRNIATLSNILFRGSGASALKLLTALDMACGLLGTVTIPKRCVAIANAEKCNGPVNDAKGIIENNNGRGNLPKGIIENNNGRGNLPKGIIENNNGRGNLPKGIIENNNGCGNLPKGIIENNDGCGNLPKGIIENNNGCGTFPRHYRKQ